MDPQEEPPRKRKCQNCNRRINILNYEIHLNKCKLKERKLTKKETEQRLKEAKEAIKREDEANSQTQEREESRAQVVGRQEEEAEDKFPCHLCGFEQNFADLDLHPQRCPNRMISCLYCRLNFPRNIMFSHQEVCERRPRFVPPPLVPPTSIVSSSSQSAPVIAESVFPPANRPSPPPPVSIPPPIMIPATIPNATRPPSIPVASTVPPRLPAFLAARSATIPNESRPQAPVRPAQNRSETVNNLSSGRAARVEQHRERTQAHGESRPQFNPYANRLATSIFARNDPPSRPAHTSISQRNGPSHSVARNNSTNSTGSEREASNPSNNRVASSSYSSGQRLRQIVASHAAMVNQEIQRTRHMRQLIEELAARHASSKEEGLPRELIKCIPEKDYMAVQGVEDQMCSICCTDFEKGDSLKDFKCKHLFHSKCISDWLRINRSCPLCKTDLSVNIRPPFRVEQNTQQKKAPPRNGDWASVLEEGEIEED